uniref:HNH endonuclease signature motif containing protein n=1 Tax=Microbispora cellulosiformans TaxID=2614688 RepID=UPI00178125CD|nr:HNH endonuclease signature motif containing protein [Microbispora cellulosiformans]
MALVPVPETAAVCLAEAEELLSARDRITSALAARVGRVHRAGEAKSHGHASTKLWLRSAGGMTPAGASRLVTMSMELHRLSQVRERFAEGTLPEGIVEAICTATAGLTDDQATTAEGILLELAGSAGAAEVAKAGRYLRAVLDPDGHEKDEQADFDRRFLRVRKRRNGGVEGEFYLPVEAAARLQQMLEVYAKPKAEGDDRTLSVRNADALIAFLENRIATELLVLVYAESLPDDPPSGTPSDDSEPTVEEPAGEESKSAEPDDRPSTVSPEHTATVPPAGGDRSADEDRCSAVAPSAGDDASPATFPGAFPATSSAAAGAGADGQEPATGRAAAGSSPTNGPAAAWPHVDPTQSDERGDLRDGDDIQQGHANDPDADPGAQEEGIERGHRRNRARRSKQAPPQQAHAPESPPEHDAPPGAEHGGDIWPGDDAWPGGDAWAGAGADAPPGAECGGGAWPGGEPWPGVGADASPGVEHSDDTWPGDDARLGGDAWAGDSAGVRSGVGVNSPPGVWLRGFPGLILATGQLLPVSSVHRLARSSTLVRIVMDAAGQVLDMGRKVRLATPAQRRAVFARYATCWVDGCPLPATLCQIDHADDWCSGGLTDLKLLGPACQFHNRDRYRHPTRYTRRKVGDDRWAFTYRNPRTTWRR